MASRRRNAKSIEIVSGTTPFWLLGSDPLYFYKGAFYDCDSLERINVDKTIANMEVIAEDAFYNNQVTRKVPIVSPGRCHDS